jgi:ATP-binding cassette subfamily C protein LapB
VQFFSSYGQSETRLSASSAATPNATAPPSTAKRARVSFAGPFRHGLKLVFDMPIIAATLVINLLSLALPAVLLQVYDRIVPNNSVDTLYLLIIGLAICFVLDAVLRSARAALAGWSGARYEFRIGVAAVERVLHGDPRAVENASVGVHLDRLSAIDQLRDFYANQGATVLVDLPFVFLFLGFIAVIGGNLVLVPIVLMVIFGWAALRTGARLRDALTSRGVIDDRRMSFIIEVLTGAHTMKALAMETLMIRRYERLMNSAAQEVYRTAILSNVAQNLGAVFTQIASFAVAAFGAMSVLDNTMTLGSLAACTMLAGRAMQPMLRAMGIWTQFQSIRVAHERLANLFDMPMEAGYGARPITVDKGTIAFDNVHFSYDGRREVYGGLSLAIGAGECVGISGGNGAGKSTLVALMAGLQMPNSGVVRLDGHDLRGVDRRSYVRAIGYLPQHCTLFTGTILDNLVMFRGRKYHDEALRLAGELGLDEYIARMPHGYETRIDSSAHDQLPGGVRQRIAVVRALVEKPRVILFDEANTALDQQSDAKLRRLLETLRGKTTMVLVSYRPSLLELADRRFELIKGELHLRPPIAPGSAQGQERV